ncbi:hypothetical protein A2V56_02325 [Candidatus Woesebacteria bacterium RBG_19FT_COMBO_42_9]|uniref:Uncharacterized protein n=1 Tax=Candidatus Woesebacteria bacterium RBG_16_42_24 TaxID=1802485 RepID=A0A1F7XLT3_9BACT|nr:MAG: hypothetical protein A2V97_03145 [Candidatus Woesebacteria bacterium RBG_16_42_24]OGM16959.1 MAG: hypothetical protein A2V56_02325 [Candidatus Woesebacteria bacterium RBG_19FT_COMBO_42_9]OGM66752.1 MAG: hypothetical protein A2985_03605 [Candidatus Woesebacteria bacterium RIFCSPLOWO2_01_FULL_43_11]
MNTKRGFTPILILAIFGLIAVVGYLAIKGYIFSTSPPASITPSTQIQNSITEWQTYTNTEYYYSIKYPPTFRTQVISSESGTTEAPPNARSLYIYNPDIEEPYVNRHISLEVLGLPPTYGSEWTSTQISLGDKDATKLVNSKSGNFDIYLVHLDNNLGVVEIYVSNMEDKRTVSNQILSTLRFDSGQ